MREIRNEKAAQRVSFGGSYPADVHADIPADVRGQKLRSGLEILEKNKHFGADMHDPKARTSMTPGGKKKNETSVGPKDLQAEFSFPRKDPKDREGANREKLTVKKSSTTRFFFSPFMSLINREKLCVNREKIGTKP